MIINSKHRCLSGLICALIFSACSLLAGPEKKFDVRPLDSNILITILEDLTEPERPFSLRLWTEKEDYVGLKLKTSVEQSGSEFLIVIDGLVNDEEFVVGPFPWHAFGRVELGPMVSGTYGLRFFGRNRITTPAVFEARVSEKSFEIIRKRSGPADFERYEYRLIPENTIWGFLQCRSEDATHTARVFLDSLRASGAGPANALPGYYERVKGEDSYFWQAFEIDQEGNIHPYGGAWWGGPVYEDIGFILRWEGELGQLRDIVRHFAVTTMDTTVSAYSPMMNPIVFTWRGLRYVGSLLIREP